MNLFKNYHLILLSGNDKCKSADIQWFNAFRMYL